MSTPAIAVLTVAELAALLQCADTTVRDRADELGGLKFGRDYVFPAGAVSKRLEELALQPRKAPPKPSATLHALPAAKKRQKAPPRLPTLPE